MSENFCPFCGQAIPIDQINMAEGVGLCKGCGKLSRLSEIVDQGQPVDFDGPIPAGCSMDDFGGQTHIRASMRSIGTGLGALAMCLFWNGIVSVFVLIAVAGLYTNLVGPLPAWFPAPDFDEAMPLGMTLFLCIFLIPFVLVGAALAFAVLACFFGRIDVRLRGAEGRVRTGVGPLGWTRRFDASQVKRVTIGESTWKQNDQAKPVICIEADRTIKFGSLLTTARRDWLRSVLHVLLVAPPGRR